MTRTVVLFDLDGTLVNSNASVARCWKNLADRAGFDVSVLSDLHGIPARAFIKMLLGPQRESEYEELSQWHLEQECQDTHDTFAFPVAMPLIEWIDNNPAAEWGIVTSCERVLALARLNATGLPVPEMLISANDVEHGKPHPEPYLKGAAALAQPGDRVIVVEDAPAGIRSGLDAGATVLAVTTSHEAAKLTHATEIVETLGGVLAYLQQLDANDSK